MSATARDTPGGEHVESLTVQIVSLAETILAQRPLGDPPVTPDAHHLSEHKHDHDPREEQKAACRAHVGSVGAAADRALVNLRCARRRERDDSAVSPGQYSIAHPP